MTDGWTRHTLEEIASIKQGRYLSKGAMQPNPSAEFPVPVVGANGVLGYTTSPSESQPVALVTCRGNGCGLVQWLDGPAWVSNNAMSLNGKPGFDNSFIRYMALNADFADVTTGSAQPQITVGNLGRKTFLVPGIEEQRRIADALEVLDQSIAVNETLVSDLMDAVRLVSDVSLGGSRKPLSEIADIRRGVSYKSTDFSQTRGTPSISMGACTRSGLLNRTKIRKLDKDVAERYLVRPRDIVMANVDLTWALGILAWPILVPDDLGERIAITSDMFSLHLKAKYAHLSPAIWAQLMNQQFRDWISGRAKGTTVASISKEDILAYEVRTQCPPAALDMATHLVHLAWALVAENRELAQTRDELLPLLMSGRVRVKDVAA